MAVDNSNKFLVTADVDGQVRSWHIEDYCMNEPENGQHTSNPPSESTAIIVMSQKIKFLAAKSSFN